MQRRRFLAVATAGATAGCSTLPGIGDSKLDPETVARKTHDRVNERRAEAGVGTLDYDGDLAAIAAAHSEDMAERGYFDHVDPEGDTWTDRYEAAGYDCRIDLDDGRTATGGENISQVVFSDTSFTNEGMAAKTVDGWMDSKTHRRNLLAGYWTVEGVGVHVAESDDGTRVDVTQNFC